MRQQRKRFQMKAKDKTPEEELSDMEIGNLRKEEFRVMITNTTQELRKRMDAQSEKLQEGFNK